MEFNLNDVKIEKARVENAKEILKLLNSSHNLVGYRGERFSLDEVKDYLSQKINLVLIGKIKNKIISVIIANFWKEYCYLYLFAVSKESRHKGVGTKMLNFLEDKAKNEGYIGLIVKEKNKEMINLIKKRNYVPGDKFIYFHKNLDK